MQLCEQHVQTLSAQHAQQPWGASTLGVHIGTDPQVFETCDTKHITPGCCLGCTGNLGLPFFIIIATLAFFFFFFFCKHSKQHPSESLVCTCTYDDETPLKAVDGSCHSISPFHCSVNHG